MQIINLDNRTIAPFTSAIGSSYSTTISSLIVDSIEVYPEERGAGIPVNLQSILIPPSPIKSISNYRTGSDAGSISDTDNF